VIVTATGWSTGLACARVLAMGGGNELKTTLADPEANLPHLFDGFIEASFRQQLLIQFNFAPLNGLARHVGTHDSDKLM
jgi:hypothetical protein